MTHTTLRGWVHDLRDMGGLKFIQLRDSIGITQVTVKADADPAIIETAKRLTLESVIEVVGVLQDNPKAKTGKELLPQSITLLAQSKPELPISVNEKAITTALPKRLDWRCLDLRKSRSQAIFRIESAIIEGMQRHLFSEGFTQVFTPCLMGVASESGSEVFPVIYFDREAFLRQDPQLHRQLTIAGGLQKIFDIGPSWRAEQSHTVKHLCEHRVCAVEAAFIKDEYDTMRIEEQVIIAAMANVKERCAAEIATLGITVTVPQAPFPVFTYPEAVELLKGYGKELDPEGDMDSEAERLLWEHVQKTTGSEFYFLDKFPYKIKPFYVMRDGDSKHARSVDLYFKGMELSSGGQREHRYDELMAAVKEKGVNTAEIEWFTKFFAYGVPPHGGFAIGIERITQMVVGVENIRECVLFPRDPERLVP